MIVPERDGILFELGSGFGLLAIDIAKAFPNKQVYAYEGSFFPWLFSLCLIKCMRLNNITLYYQDFFDIPLTKASVVICYLYPGAMTKLKGKFENELPPRAIVISNTFAVPGWKPSEVQRMDDLYQTPLYRYNYKPLE